MTNKKILKAKGKLHTGRIFGTVSSGGSFNVGNIQVEVVADGSKFVTVQVYEYGLDEDIAKQSWIKTKKVVVEKEVEKKDKKGQVEFKHSEEVKVW